MFSEGNRCKKRDKSSMIYPSFNSVALIVVKNSTEQLVVFALNWVNTDVIATGFGLENYCAINKSVESVVLAHTHVCTRVVNCATLTLDYVASFCKRATKNFNAESFAF